MRHRILSVVVILVFALGTVVLADPPTVTIEQQATLDQFISVRCSYVSPQTKRPADLYDSRH